MSIVFGLLTSDPNLLPCELHRLRETVRLSAPETTHNAVGVGSYAGETVLMHQYPSPVAPATPSQIPVSAKSQALLYHAGTLPVGTSLEDNTQPFRFRRWLFAQNGELPGYRTFKQQLWEDLPEHLKRHVRGETAGEIAFATFLKKLRDSGRSDDQPVNPQHAMEVLGATARRVQALSAQTGSDSPGGITLIATNGELMIACRVGGAPLFTQVLEGRSECTLHHLVRSSPQSQPLLHAHERCRTVVLASQVVTADGWIELTDGSAIAIHQGELHRDSI